MSTIKPALNPDVRTALAKARTIHLYILQQAPQSLVLEGDAKEMFAGYFALADDLHWSILVLFEQGGPSDGGAFALLRPLLDATIRGQWLLFCAKSELAKRARNGEDIFPGLPCMIESLDRTAGGDLFQPVKKGMRSFHGFTHGGVEQLSRRFDSAGNLSANYSDADKISALTGATFYFESFAEVFCQVMFEGHFKDDPHSKLIWAQYRRLYDPAE